MPRSRTIEVVLLAVDKTKQGFRSVLSGLERTTRALKGFAEQMGLVFGAGGVGTAAAVKELADEMARLARVAERLGTTTEALSRLSFAARRTGVDAATLEDALNNLVVRVGEATEGTGEGYEAFERLGLAVKDLIDLAPEEQFLLLADALRRVNTQAERVQLVDQIFGDTQILQTLQLGRTEIERLGDELEELGGVIDDEAAAAAARFNKQIDLMNEKLRGIGIEATENVLPFLTFITSWTSGNSLAQAFADAEGRLEELPPRLRELRIEMDDLAARIRKLQLGTILPDFVRDEYIKRYSQQLAAVQEAWIAENKRLTAELDQQTEAHVDIQQTLQERLTEYLQQQQEKRVKSFEQYVSDINKLRREEQTLLEEIANAGRETVEGIEAVQIGDTLDPGDLFIRLQDALRQLGSDDADAARQTLDNIVEAMNELSKEGNLNILTAQQLRDNLAALARDITEVRQQEIIDAAGQKAEVEDLGRAVSEIQQTTGEQGEPLFTQIFDFEQVRADAQRAVGIIQSEVDGNRVEIKTVPNTSSVVATRAEIERGVSGIEAEVEPVVAIVRGIGEFGEPSFSNASAAEGHKVP